jgi:hypothetical protein
MFSAAGPALALFSSQDPIKKVTADQAFDNLEKECPRRITGLGLLFAARSRRARIDLPSLAIQLVVGNYIGFGGTLAKMNAVNDVVRMWLGTALWCALFIMASRAETLAQSRHSDAGIGHSQLSFLSEPRDETGQPAEETPRSAPQQDNKNFDGAWTFTSAGCPHTGSLPAMIVSGRIIIRGGSGQVDPDGTLHSVGAGNGMTLTAVGRLSGNTGAGTFNRSDGCVGSWIAIKR